MKTRLRRQAGRRLLVQLLTTRAPRHAAAAEGQDLRQGRATAAGEIAVIERWVKEGANSMAK